MTMKKKQIYFNLAAFLLLFFVSLYRQLSLRHFPSDPFRTYILYGCYLLLLALWAFSILLRVTQESMRLFLLGEDIVMLFGLTVRFVQDTFLSENIPLLRTTGLLISTTLLPLMILGIYASLCIGRGDDYRIPARWYLLLLPALILFPLILTDNSHHFFTYIVPEEPQPNLTYHPSIGFFLVFGLILGLAVFRVFLIYRRNNRMDQRPVLRRIIPALEGILLLVFFLPYIVNWMQKDAPIAPPEVIEQYAKLYYAEVLTWEVYIFLGLVPVNMDYREIFAQSTLGLQILSGDAPQIRSSRAEMLTPELTARLRTEGRAELSGRELRMYRLRGAEVVWSKDISELQAAIKELDRSAEKLAQEGILLREEMRAKTEQASITAKNEIYDTLFHEVRAQTDRIREICRSAPGSRNHFRKKEKLYLLGTYVKRRCNLRLIGWENGEIEADDLVLSLQEMKTAMAPLGIRCSLEWEEKTDLTPHFALAVFDRTEALLEEEDFRVKELGLRIAGETAFFTVYSAEEGAMPRQDAVFGQEAVRREMISGEGQ